MSSRVGTVNFPKQVHNDTFTSSQFNFFESDGETGLDLSDVTPKVQIRMGSYNGKLVKTCTIGDGLSWVDQNNGQLQMGGFVMSWPKAGDYYYDIQFTYATSGIIRTYIRGKIEVIDDATA